MRRAVHERTAEEGRESHETNKAKAMSRKGGATGLMVRLGKYSDATGQTPRAILAFGVPRVAERAK